MGKSDPIIPTTYKAKLPHDPSFPLGAQTVTNALRRVPQFDQLKIDFRGRPIFSATQFRAMLREGTPYVVFEARFDRHATSAGTPRRLDAFWKEWYAKRWELRVYPVLRSNRHAARTALIGVALPDVKRWLSQPEAMTWETGHKRREYAFDPASASLTIKELGDALS